MDEILALQQQLAAAQRSTTSQRLSERNCVELVMKLQSLNLIELIFTRSGKEYLTPIQLVQEIEDEVLTHGGRINLTDLPEALNVSLSHIEAALPHITDGSSIRLIRGEIITDYYLASLIDELNDTLATSDSGTDSLADVATRYSLPVDILRETLSAAGDKLAAHFDPESGTLTSDAAVARYRAASRGLLRATTSPASLAELSELVDVPVAALHSMAEELLTDGVIAGVIEGRAARAVFVPAIFATAAAQVLTDDFSANGFVRLDAFAKLHISDPETFAEKHLSGAVVLGSCVVQYVLFETLATSTTEALTARSWLDLVASLPAGFPERDIKQFVTRVATIVEQQRATEMNGDVSTSKKESGSGKGKRKGRSSALSKEVSRKSTILFESQFVVSPEVLQLFENCITKDASEKADIRAKEITAKMETVGNQAEAVRADPEEGEKDTGKKSKGKGRRRAGKDKSGSKANTATNGEGSSVSSQFPVSIPSIEEAVEIILSDEVCAKVIESDYLEVSTEGENMLQNVLEATYDDSGLRDLYTTKASEAVETLERERVLARKNAEKALLSDLHHAELYFISAASLPSDELISASREWVIDSICTNIVCRVVQAAAQSTGLLIAGVARAHDLPSKREKLEFVRTACTQLAPTIANKVRELVTIVSGKEESSVQQFLEGYDGAVTILDLPERRPLDKKGERASHANLCAQLVSSFDDESLSERAAFKTAVVLTHAKSSAGSIVGFRDQDAIGFCVAIEENVKPAEAATALCELRKSLIDYEKERETSEDRTSNFSEKLRALREYIG